MTTFAQTEALFSAVDEKLINYPVQINYPANTDHLIYTFPLNQYVRSTIIINTMVITPQAGIYLVRADSGQKFFIAGTNALSVDLLKSEMVYRNGDQLRLITTSNVSSYNVEGFVQFFNKKYYLS